MRILLKKRRRRQEPENNKRAVCRVAIACRFTALFCLYAENPHFLLSDACQSLDGILFNNNLKMFCEIVRHTIV